MGTTTSMNIGGIDFSKTSGDRKRWDPKTEKWVAQNTYSVAGVKWYKNKPPNGGKEGNEG